MKPKPIITFAILVLTGMFVFTLVLPKIEEAVASQKKFSSKKEEVELARTKFETTKQAINQFQSLAKAEIERVNSAFPDVVDLPDLFVLVDSLISKPGLIGEDIRVNVREEQTKERSALTPASGAIAPRFLDVEETKGFGEIDINFSIVGDYESFKVFLGDVEKSLRIFDVQSVSFAVPQQAEKIAGAFRFGVNMKTYYNK